MKTFLTWLRCLLTGHLWETRSHGDDIDIVTRAAREDWRVCLRCEKDTRQCWEIHDDLNVRMERIARRAGAKVE